MNDWWNYLEHGQEGQERKNHKYYARVAVGKNKLGFTQYRYFYDAREYGAYMTRNKNNSFYPKAAPKKGTTYYVTGWGKSLVDDDTVNKDIQRARGLGIYTAHKLSNDKGELTGGAASTSAKTVKDRKKRRKDAIQRGKAKVASLLRKAANKIDS